MGWFDAAESAIWGCEWCVRSGYLDGPGKCIIAELAERDFNTKAWFYGSTCLS